MITVAVGAVFAAICQVWAEPIVRLFSKESELVVTLGGQYLRAYSLDCAIASIHFCFSGYFCAYERSVLSFVHNLISVLAIRIPGAYLASALFPDTLYPMGLAAPAGSLVSVIICLIMFLVLRKKQVF